MRVVQPKDNYAYVNQAYGMSNAIGQAPPDYSFDYEGVRPWVWRTADNAVRVVEPTQGGHRYYYYQPGARYPYLVQDPQYAYGYSNGQLAAVYDRAGRPLAPDLVDERAEWAGRYLQRAQRLYEAATRSQRQAVIAANWAAQRDQIDAQRAEWARQQAQSEAWRAYHDDHEAEQAAYWRSERQRRERSARAFNDWSGRGYQGPPPPVYDDPGRGDGRPVAMVAGALAGLPAGRAARGDQGQTPGLPPNTFPDRIHGNPGPGGDRPPPADARQGGAPRQAPLSSNAPADAPRGSPAPPPIQTQDPTQSAADSLRRAQADAAVTQLNQSRQAQAQQQALSAAEAQRRAQADAAAAQSKAADSRRVAQPNLAQQVQRQAQTKEAAQARAQPPKAETAKAVPARATPPPSDQADAARLTQQQKQASLRAQAETLSSGRATHAPIAPGPPTAPHSGAPPASHAPVPTAPGPRAHEPESAPAPQKPGPPKTEQKDTGKAAEDPRHNRRPGETGGPPQ